MDSADMRRPFYSGERIMAHGALVYEVSGGHSYLVSRDMSLNLYHFMDKFSMSQKHAFDPLKPHFYTVKLRFTEVQLNFPITAQSIDYGYLLEPPSSGGKILNIFE